MNNIITATRKLRYTYFDIEQAEEFLTLLSPNSQLHNFVIHCGGTVVYDGLGSLAEKLDHFKRENQRGCRILVRLNELDHTGRDAKRVRAITTRTWRGDSPVAPYNLPPSIVLETAPDRLESLWLVEGDWSLGTGHDGTLGRADYLMSLIAVPGFWRGDHLVMIKGGNRRRYAKEELTKGIGVHERIRAI